MNMPNKLINMRLPEQIVKEIETVIASEGHTNVQEFIKESIRASLQKYRIERARIELDKLAGSVKTYRKVSKKDMDKHIRKVFG